MGFLDRFIRTKKQHPETVMPPRIELRDAPGERPLVDAMGDFGLEVLRNAAGNELCSPLSLYQVWMRVWAGSRGACRDEIGRALALDASPTDARVALRELTVAMTPPPLPRELSHPPAIPGLDPPKPKHLELRSAQALWVRPGLPIEPSFTDVWGATTREIDFADAASAAAEVNRWVEEQTRGFLRNVIDPSAIQPDLALMLADATYLHASWADPFVATATLPREFAVPAGGHVTVPTMNDQAMYECVQTDTFALLRKPYVGEHHEMVLVLPPQGQLDEVLRTLRWAHVNQARAGTESTMTILELPKLSYGSQPEIDPLLANRGACAIYDPARADLRDLSPVARAPGGELFVGQTTHIARIDVDEEGTEAAAVTMVLVAGGCAPEPPRPPYRFIVDRPFAYFIVERSTGLPLFAGKVVDPS